MSDFLWLLLIGGILLEAALIIGILVFMRRRVNRVMDDPPNPDRHS